MEEKKKGKFRIWLEERKARVKEFCNAHPDGVLTVFGGLLTLVGGILKIASLSHEYEDNCYTTLDDGNVYKVPAKKMKTLKKVRKSKEES